MPADRDAGGRFQAGNPGGPGNPFARRVATLRKALLEAVGEADVAQLGRKLLAQALDGDTAAAKVLLAYLIGKPAPTVDPDTVELMAWRAVLAWPSLAELLASTASRPVPPEIAALAVRTTPDPEKAANGDKRANRSVAESALRVQRRREQERGR